VSRVARRFLLVRHGETEGSSSTRYHGSNDVPLSDLGRTQVRGLLPLLVPLRPVLVVCSPLCRAAESAAIVAAGCEYGVAPRPLAGLAEISFGDCEGLSAAEIEARFPDFWQAHRSGQSTGFPGGEPFAAFAARVRSAFASLCEEVPAGDVMVVAHRGVVRQGLRFLLGLADAAADRFGVDLGSLTVVRGGPPGGELEQFNRRGEVP
jgi:broad specificity phosphatase PhoE